MSEAGRVDLKGVVALVTGASRGVGRGVALGLLEAGATVHITGRTLVEAGSGLLAKVQADAADLPGRCVIHRVDHADDAETEAAVATVLENEGRLDILVNNAWPGYERMVEDGRYTWELPLWEQPMWRFDGMINTGLRAAYCASRPAAHAMAVQKGGGLIVNISFWAAQKFMQNVVYGLAKAGADKLTADLASELRPFGITAVSLYPGLVRTEAVMQNAAFFDLSNSESPEFQGRAVAHLFADPDRMAVSGRVVTSAALGLAYGFTDIDGRQPLPLTLETA